MVAERDTGQAAIVIVMHASVTALWALWARWVLLRRLMVTPAGAALDGSAARDAPVFLARADVSGR